MLAGEAIFSIGVSEPDAGSDVAGIRTTAVEGRAGGSTAQDVHPAVYGDLTIVAAQADLENKYGITMFSFPPVQRASRSPTSSTSTGGAVPHGRAGP